MKVIGHPSYTTSTKDSDFGIIHLTDAVTDILPAVIAKEATESGTPVSLYGWGRIEKQGKLLNSLQRLDTTFISAADCAPMWDGVKSITRYMNCDSAPEKNQGSCNGDHGGPIVNEYNELVGTMGVYDYCAAESEGRPEINNDVSEVIDWIDLNTI